MLFSRYVCAACGYELPSGWGAVLYVTKDSGQRIVCPHPLEHETILRETGMTYEQAAASDRLGYLTQCVCIACQRQFALDLGRDEMKCVSCSSTDVRTAAELIGHQCPRCRNGIIQDRAVQFSAEEKMSRITIHPAEDLPRRHGDSEAHAMPGRHFATEWVKA